MLRSIQIKIVLIFLVLGMVIIGVMGYTNYINLQKIIETPINNVEECTTMIHEYQEQLKIITLYTVLMFTLICVLVRSFCNAKGNSANK